ncbi:MAG: tRNA pseudouridine(38-40) synthase TruA [Chloroflexota bacterium]
MTARANADDELAAQARPQGRHLACLVSYDGTDFAGFQVQPGQRTVQAELEAALLRITGEPGRVHAIGQVAAFWTCSQLAPADLQRALNAVLPPDVAVRALQLVPAEFHPRFSALWREYVYSIQVGPVRSPRWRRFALHQAQSLDLAAMQRAGQRFVGVHDFAAFAAEEEPGASTIREVLDVRCWEEDRDDAHLVQIAVRANAFVRHMVRRMIGSLLRVGHGALPEDAIDEIIQAKDRRLAGPTLAPHGLCLVQVAYPAGLFEATVAVVAEPAARRTDDNV